jgi:DNA-binding NtrC family response regulator
MSTRSNLLKFLLIDDDRNFHLALKFAFKKRADFFSAYNSNEALTQARKNLFDFILLDIHLGESEDGLALLGQLKELNPEATLIVVSGSEDYTLVRKALKLGADNYLCKGRDLEEVEHLLENAIQTKLLISKNAQREYELQTAQQKNVLIGKSAAIEQLRNRIERVKNSSANVLITGETGTGKEVVARLLRGFTSEKQMVPFVAIDSATIQSTMAESILFGHEKGAFTGADQARKGVFEEANGGIVYFDELGNMPLEIQANLLRVLQEKQVSRLGSSKVLDLEFRVVAATNRDLENMCAKGLFKDDLLQRVNVIPIEIPPLRERLEDLPLLVNHLCRNHSKGSRSTLEWSDEAWSALLNYNWPGNVRELSNLVAYLLTMVDQSTIEVSDLPKKILKSRNSDLEVLNSTENPGFYAQVQEFEKLLLRQAYTKSKNNLSKLAMDLRMDRSHLYTKLKDYGIHATKPRASL